MKMNSSILGWDIGGAHLKFVELSCSGEIISTAQYATPLWQGLETLEQCLLNTKQRYSGRKIRHALTMTGELVDFFSSRDEGVKAILDVFLSVFENTGTLVYAGSDGLVCADGVMGQLSNVASANWHATATYLGTVRKDCLLVDMGSTTTDLVMVREGVPQNKGYSDRQRMVHGELVYTGLIRTPVMAVTQVVVVDGETQGLAAELFATMADVYRILGCLNESHDLYPAADGGEKTKEGSMRRLAHMLGADYEVELDDVQLTEAARYIAMEQAQQLKQAIVHLTGREDTHQPLQIIGAGVGRELIRSMALDLHCKFSDLGCILGDQDNQNGLADIAPAIAVAQLARQEHESQIN